MSGSSPTNTTCSWVIGGCAERGVPAERLGREFPGYARLATRRVMSSACGAPAVNSLSAAVTASTISRAGRVRFCSEHGQNAPRRIRLVRTVGLGDAVAIEHQQVAWSEVGALLAVWSHGKTPSTGPLPSSIWPPPRRAPGWRIVARIGERQLARGRIEHAEKESDEAVAGAVGAGGLVEPRHETARLPGSSASTCTRACSAIIISDAGMPLPETSPSARPTRPSG